MLYCSKCDKRLTPDHVCGFTRRFFFGLLAGAAAAAALPVPLSANVIRKGDLLRVNFSAMAPRGPSVLVTFDTPKGDLYACLSHSGGPSLFVADSDYVIKSVKGVDGSLAVRDLPFEIQRRPKPRPW